MHKYQPIIHITSQSGGERKYLESCFIIFQLSLPELLLTIIIMIILFNFAPPTEGMAERKSFQFAQTVFTTVTAYQNQQVL